MMIAFAFPRPSLHPALWLTALAALPAGLFAAPERPVPARQPTVATVATAPLSSHATAPATVPGTVPMPATAPAARPAVASPAPREDVLGCLLTPFSEARVGSPVVGVISRVLVDRGSVVAKGQPLATLLDSVERASASAASQRYLNGADVAAAQSAAELARKKAQRAQELYDLNFISSQARDQAVSEAEVATMQHAKAQEQRLSAGKELAIANAQLSLRTIVSPMSGVVVERYLAVGERVEDKPVLKLAQIDPLKVEVIVPASRFNTLRAGGSATVQPELQGLGARTAQITQVDAVIDASSNTFRVRLELPNPGNVIPAGLRCKVAFSG